MIKKQIVPIVSLITVATPLVTTIACGDSGNWVNFNLSATYGVDFISKITDGYQEDAPNAIFSDITKLEMEVEKEHEGWEVEIDIIGKALNTNENLYLEIDSMMNENKIAAPYEGFAWIEYEINDQEDILIPDLATVMPSETEKVNIIYLTKLLLKYLPDEYKILLDPNFITFLNSIYTS